MAKIFDENTWNRLVILDVKIIWSLILGEKKPRASAYTRATTANESPKLKFGTDRRELELGRSGMPKGLPYMRAASIYQGPWIGPVRKLCAAKKQRVMKHPECLPPGTGH